jgi:hypothetical protein
MRIVPIQQIASARNGRYQVWARWDDDAMIYELFASAAADDYVGCAADMHEARDIAQRLIREWQSF